MKDMSSREILDAIRTGVEESARRLAERKARHAPPPLLQAQPTRSIAQMTPREILEAIDSGLEETSLRFVRDDVEHSDSLPKAEEQVPPGHN
jgi:hypothetical protein